MQDQGDIGQCHPALTSLLQSYPEFASEIVCHPQMSPSLSVCLLELLTYGVINISVALAEMLNDSGGVRDELLTGVMQLLSHVYPHVMIALFRQGTKSSRPTPCLAGGPNIIG